MDALPTTLFRSLDFSLHNGRAVFAASGEVRWEAGTPPPLMATLGAGGERDEVLTIPGTSPPETIFKWLEDAAGEFAGHVLADLQEDFAGLQTESSLWFRANREGERTAWLTVFNRDRIDLIGVQSLAAAPVQIPGLQLGADARLAVYVQLRGEAIDIIPYRSRLLVSSDVSAASSMGIGPVSLASASNGQLILSLQADEIPDLGTLLDDPASLLDARFDGRMQVAFKGKYNNRFYNLDVDTDVEQEISLNAQVHSPRAERTLNIVHLDYHHVFTASSSSIFTAGLLPDDFTVGSLTLNAKLENFSLDTDSGDAAVDRIELQGTASFDLPASGLFQPGATSSLQAGIRMVYDVSDDDLIEFLFEADKLPLADGLFILPAADLRLSLRRLHPDHMDNPPANPDDRTWSLVARARLVQEWQELARALATHVNMVFADADGPLPTDFDMPALRCTVEATAESGTDAHLQMLLELVEPLPVAQRDLSLPSVEHYSAYAGSLGPLPLDISDASILLDIDIGSSGTALQARGGTILNSHWERVGAAGIMPALIDTSCHFTVDAGGDATPELHIVIENLSGDGLFFSLPPLQPGLQAVDLLQLHKVSINLGNSFGFHAEVGFPRTRSHTVFDVLSDQLPLPDGWGNLINELEHAAADIVGVVDFCMPVSGQAGTSDCPHPRLSIRLMLDRDGLADDEGYIDLFETMFAGMDYVYEAVADHPQQDLAQGGMLQDQRSAQFPPPPESGDPLDQEKLLGVIMFRPLGIGFEVTLPQGEPTGMRLQTGIECRVAGETFDAGLILELVGGEPRARIGAGFDDPIRISIPAPPAPLEPDWKQFAEEMGLNWSVTSSGEPTAGSDASMKSVRQLWKQFMQQAAVASEEPLLSFEISNLQLFFRPTDPNNPVGLSGDVQIVRFPPMLNEILPNPGPRGVLGATPSSVFIQILPPVVDSVSGLAPPLVSIPVKHEQVSVGGHTETRTQSIDLILNAFSFAYSWAPSSFQCKLNAAINIPPIVNEQTKYLPVVYRLPDRTSGAPSAWIDLELRQLTAEAPPIILWSFKFGNTNAPHNTYVNSLGTRIDGNRGFEYVWQIPVVPELSGGTLVDTSEEPTELYNLYVRQFSLIPMNLLMQPAIVLDWGVQFGPRDAPILQVQFRRGTLQLYHGAMAAMTPWSLFLPPLLPPVLPGGAVALVAGAVPLMDFFTGAPIDVDGSDIAFDSNRILEVGEPTDPDQDHAVQVNGGIPGVIDFYAGFSRPEPTVPLPAIIEMIVIGQKILQGGFDPATGFNPADIPEDAAVRDIMYLSADCSLELPILEVLFPDGIPPELDALNFAAHFDVDLIDVFNVFYTLGHQVLDHGRHLLDQGKDLVGKAEIEFRHKRDEITEAIGQFITDLTTDQSGLVSLIPVELRSIAPPVSGSAGFRIPGMTVELDYSLSAHLLLPKELEYELRLYHENKRVLGARAGWEAESPQGVTPAGGEDSDSGTRRPLDGKLEWIRKEYIDASLYKDPPDRYGERFKKESERFGKRLDESVVPRLRQRWANMVVKALFKSAGGAAGVNRIITAESLSGIRSELQEIVKAYARTRSASGRKKQLNKARAVILSHTTSSKRLSMVLYDAIVSQAENLAESVLDRMLIRNPVPNANVKIPVVNGSISERKKVMREALSLAGMPADLALNIEKEFDHARGGPLLKPAELRQMETGIRSRIEGHVRGHRNTSAMSRRAVSTAVKNIMNGLLTSRKVEVLRFKPVASGTRKQIVRDLITDRHGIRGKFDAAIDKWIAENDFKQLYQEREMTARYQQMIDEVAALIRESAVISRKDKLNSAQVAKTARESIRDNLYTPPRYRDRTPGSAASRNLASGFYSGNQSTRMMAAILPGRFRFTPHPTPAVPADSGLPEYSYELRFMTREDEPAVDWSVHVGHAMPVIDVRFVMGQYRVFVDGEASGDSLVIDAAVEPHGPDRAQRLRARLKVTDVQGWRQQLDDARHDDQPWSAGEASGNDLYKQSIFSAWGNDNRLLYRIMDNSDDPEIHGRHGHVNLADLLVRREAGKNTYLVPDRPVLIAGINLKFLQQDISVIGLRQDWMINLCGIVLPALRDRDSGNSEDAFFFNAAGEYELDFGYQNNGVYLYLSGEFRLFHGQVWQQAVAVDLLDTLSGSGHGFVADALGFDGNLGITYRSGGSIRELLTVACSGQAGDQGLVLTFSMNVDGSFSWGGDDGLMGQLQNLLSGPQLGFVQASVTVTGEISFELKMGKDGCELILPEQDGLQVVFSIDYDISESVRKPVVGACHTVSDLVAEVPILGRVAETFCETVDTWVTEVSSGSFELNQTIPVIKQNIRLKDLGTQLLNLNLGAQLEGVLEGFGGALDGDISINLPADLNIPLPHDILAGDDG